MARLEAGIMKWWESGVRLARDEDLPPARNLFGELAAAIATRRKAKPAKDASSEEQSSALSDLSSTMSATPDGGGSSGSPSAESTAAFSGPSGGFAGVPDRSAPTNARELSGQLSELGG